MIQILEMFTLTFFPVRQYGIMIKAETGLCPNSRFLYISKLQLEGLEQGLAQSSCSTNICRISFVFLI